MVGIDNIDPHEMHSDADANTLTKIKCNLLVPMPRILPAQKDNYQKCLAGQPFSIVPTGGQQTTNNIPPYASTYKQPMSTGTKVGIIAVSLLVAGAIVGVIIYIRHKHHTAQ